MVNYDSINLGLKVEFIKDETICRGTVRYKGGLNGKQGVFVGIETDKPVGNCDGRLLGRVYFKCSDKHGLFLTADDIRLASNIKKKRKCLKKSTKSECDELLFKNFFPEVKVNTITEDYLRRAKTCFGQSYDNIFTNQRRYTKNSYLVFCPKGPKSDDSKNSCFQRQSSIQKTIMPKEEMKMYTSLNWSYKNISLPKNTDLSNAFDGFNLSRENYIGT